MVQSLALTVYMSKYLWQDTESKVACMAARGVQVHVYVFSVCVHSLMLFVWWFNDKIIANKWFTAKERFLFWWHSWLWSLAFVFSPLSSSLHFSCVCSSHSRQTKVDQVQVSCAVPNTHTDPHTHTKKWPQRSSNKMNFPIAKCVPRMRYLCWLYYHQHRIFWPDRLSFILQYVLFCNVGSCWCNSRLHSSMPPLIELV